MAKRKIAKSSNVVTCSAELPMFDPRDKRTKDIKHLKLLDGFYESDSLLSYIHADGLDTDGLTGGYLRCVLDDRRLMLITDFGATEKLSKPQLNALKKECLGQWSDGVGEGAFDDFGKTSGFSVDTTVSKVKVTSATGAPFKPDAKAKAKLKSLKADWKKAAKASAPKHDQAVLLKCFKAINKKQLPALKQLLASGKVDINAVCRSKTSDQDEFTLLVYAARHASVAIVKALLDEGADPNLQDDFSYGYAPLHRASSPAIVKQLLAAGADPNVRTRSFEETPLLQDEVVRHAESVKLLLEAGAKPNAPGKVYNKNPLDMAVQVSAKSTEHLLKAGAELTPRSLTMAVNPQCNVRYRTKNEVRVTIVRMLMKLGAKPDAEHLMEAVESENAELVKLFVKAKVPLNQQGEYDKISEIHPSPLTRAIAWRYDKMVKLLLQLGADPNFGEGTDHPLHVAMAEDSLAHVKLLLSAGARPEPVIEGQTLEQTARKLGSKEIAAFFAKMEGWGAAGSKKKATAASRAGSNGRKKTPEGAARKTKKSSPVAKAGTTRKTAGKRTSTRGAVKKKKASSAKKSPKKKAGAKGKAGTRRLELSDGRSHKFWELTVSGSSYEVRYGRIGTSGQASSKSFDTEAACRAAADKLVRQKLGKGYEEV